MPIGKSAALAALLVPLATGIGMLAFAGVLYMGGCGSCASSLPPALVAAAGVAWTIVAGLHRSRWSTTGAALLFSIHGFLILFLRTRPCVACLGFLAAELLSALVLGAVHVRASLPEKRVAIGSVGLVAIAAGGILAGLLAWEASSRPPVVLRASGMGDLKAYIIVRRNCPVCAEAERRLGQALEEGLPASEAIVVEEGSEIGARLVKTLDLDTFPAFVAMRNGTVIHAQSGGSVERFVRSLSP